MTTVNVPVSGVNVAFPYTHLETRFIDDILAGKTAIGLTKQPIYHVNSAVRHGYELLLRGKDPQDPRKELIPASKILKECADSELLAILSASVIQTAFSLARETSDVYHVNLEVADLTERSALYIDELKQRLKGPGAVHLEVKETGELDKDRLNVLRWLKERGHPIWLDDVLTQDRPFEFLKQDLPIHGVKVPYEQVHRVCGPRNLDGDFEAYHRLSRLAVACAAQGWEMVAEGANRNTDDKTLDKLGFQYRQLREAKEFIPLYEEIKKS